MAYSQIWGNILRSCAIIQQYCIIVNRKWID
jgi:hypothetical protein